MRRLLVLIAVILAGPGCRPESHDPGLTFYLQSIRGDDWETPPVPEAKPVGPKLNERLHSVCKWQHYWELKRDMVLLTPGQSVRRQLSPEREVEIELWDSQKLRARLYQNGKLTRSRVQPAEAAFDIMGGDNGKNQSWFIVVRRDEPRDPEAY